MRGLRLSTLCLTWLLAATAVQGQQTPLREPGGVFTQILIIDSQRFLFGSAFGQRLRDEADAQVEALAAENRMIEADLEAEELELTNRRSTMPPDEFRKLADVFDLKVQEIRQTQEQKNRAISQALEQGMQAVEAAAVPVLEQLMRDAGAAVILERQSVFMNARSIDVTEEAIRRLDEALGDGTKP